MDIMRKVMQALEQADLPLNPIGKPLYKNLDGADPTVAEHIRLLVEAQYLEADIDEYMDGSTDILIRRITLQGHEFLSVSRNDAVWTKALKKIKDAALGTTLDVVTKVCSEIAVKLITA
jgi:hypothetical protein